MGCYLRDVWERRWYVEQVCNSVKTSTRYSSPSQFLASIFTVVAAGQMAIWAIKKHKNYKKEFGKEYPRGRKAMIPFIL